jgi:hypothetical protein
MISYVLQMSSKHENLQAGPACRICRDTVPHGEQPTPTGICHHCQAKIGAVILVIMTITSGMVFFGIVGWW